MSKSLFYQLYSATIFIPNFDKHSDKADKQSDNSHIVKSLAAKKALNEFSHDFANFIKCEYGVKQVKDITSEMCQNFIDSKIDNGCSSKTAHTYKGYLSKLSKCVDRFYYIKTDYTVEIDESKIKNTDTIKQYSFTKEEIEKILDTPRQCNSLNALKFAYLTGVRVNTLERMEVRHIDFKAGQIWVKDKGGKIRFVPINEQTEKLLRECIKGKNPQDKVFGGVKKNSINRYLNRKCKQLNICTADNSKIKSGVHSIRKLWAEEFASKNGVAKTMVALSHSENRKDLENTYLHSKK